VIRLYSWRPRPTLVEFQALTIATQGRPVLLRNEYLAAENRILKARIKGRLLLSEEEKATSAEIAHRLGRRAWEEVAGAALPDTILGWYRKLIARKFDGSRFRPRVGRPRVAEEIETRTVSRSATNCSMGTAPMSPRSNGSCAR
jgi:putative transposase